ncbi:NusA-like transcription termination signal-binding factor [Natranaeroarchaeum sulfidigenes]|uniref:Probable transcription termination protein NusA n=1 Tax=Natranaeroarchaeum sulfidigenes TaxID=2784880 RepID=A0A897MVL5_9EURY|nr:NusA-like transcription termination signal-binding factor [Natranaeroarchaeum sulfidigenes]QSG04048.1 Transcription elongation factor [Natranaeroarchaeum sulfidigenes]
MTVTLSDAARQYLVAFEDATGAEARDCVVEDERVLVLVATGDMAQAIGPGGETVQKAEDRIGKDVKLVEDAPTAEEFVANALAPAAVYNVTISENEGLVAYAEVADEDTGVAIGEGGANIEAARLLAERHFDIEDIQLT